MEVRPRQSVTLDPFNPLLPNRRGWLFCSGGRGMGDTSAGAGTIPSLPKGGGALQGIGEKFSPDLHTGTGNFTVPLALPTGRNGFQPQLSLVYSTGNGNGPFGLGWALNIPGVSRKTSKGIPTYAQNDDVFVLSGAEDLVPVEER